MATVRYVQKCRNSEIGTSPVAKNGMSDCQTATLTPLNTRPNLRVLLQQLSGAGGGSSPSVCLRTVPATNFLHHAWICGGTRYPCPQVGWTATRLTKDVDSPESLGAHAASAVTTTITHSGPTIHPIPTTTTTTTVNVV
ncbi:hypothetical protein BDW22DRAFT_956667 [Trametopsis cervina]|nr:hypothetical protein BDW22DRAFT_956667 [Trametopsis cervina]